ncbi:hypothetical protein BD779DRAFT_1678670 [Infundibulicybe gibba]|nr:hypothetical protein BD779DRAFT_1678670 [Infundibulicybe gibba]
MASPHPEIVPIAVSQCAAPPGKKAVQARRDSSNPTAAPVPRSCLRGPEPTARDAPSATHPSPTISIHTSLPPPHLIPAQHSYARVVLAGTLSLAPPLQGLARSVAGPQHNTNPAAPPSHPGPSPRGARFITLPVISASLWTTAAHSTRDRRTTSSELSGEMVSKYAVRAGPPAPVGLALEPSPVLPASALPFAPPESGTCWRQRVDAPIWAATK